MKLSLLPRIVLLAAIATLAVLSTSCSTTPTQYKLYQDVSVAPTNIAVLVNSANIHVFVEAVDGQPPRDRTWNKTFHGNKLNGGFRIELAPGEHTLLVRYGPTSPPFSSGGSDTVMRGEDGTVYTTQAHKLEISFLAEAGKTYTVQMTWDPTQGWKAWTWKIPWK